MPGSQPGVVYGRRVAIVDGLRTPFVKSGKEFKDVSTLELASAVVTELLQRSGLDGDQVDRVVFGTVVHDVAAPNIAREIADVLGITANAASLRLGRAKQKLAEALRRQNPSLAGHEGDRHAEEEA